MRIKVKQEKSESRILWLPKSFEFVETELDRNSLAKESMVYFDKYSMNHIRNFACRTFFDIYRRLEIIVNLFQTREVFLMWRKFSILSVSRYERRFQPSHCKRLEQLKSTSLSRLNFLSKGVKILGRLIFHCQRKRLHKSFSYWKREIHSCIWLKRRHFDKWVIKTSRIKLLRMSAFRFWSLVVKPFTKIYRTMRLEKLRAALIRWNSYTAIERENQKRIIRLKLLFQCWKLSSIGMHSSKLLLRKVCNK